MPFRVIMQKVFPLMIVCCQYRALDPICMINPFSRAVAIIKDATNCIRFVKVFLRSVHDVYR